MSAEELEAVATIDWKTDGADPLYPGPLELVLCAFCRNTCLISERFHQAGSDQDSATCTPVLPNSVSMHWERGTASARQYLYRPGKVGYVVNIGYIGAEGAMPEGGITLAERARLRTAVKLLASKRMPFPTVFAKFG